MSTTDTQPTTAASDLRIEIWPDYWAQFEGTAAQLQAGGLIPEGFEWPRAAADKRWNAGGFTYWLRRARPAGHKGPMRSWLELDNWFIRVEVVGRDCRWRTHRNLKRKAEALLAEVNLFTTAEGASERQAAMRRFCEALKDKRFQAFKALVPGLTPRKRCRKSPPTGNVAS